MWGHMTICLWKPSLEKVVEDEEAAVAADCGRSGCPGGKPPPARAASYTVGGGRKTKNVRKARIRTYDVLKV